MKAQNELSYLSYGCESFVLMDCSLELDMLDCCDRSRKHPTGPRSLAYVHCNHHPWPPSTTFLILVQTMLEDDMHSLCFPTSDRCPLIYFVFVPSGSCRLSQCTLCNILPLNHLQMQPWLWGQCRTLRICLPSSAYKIVSRFRYCIRVQYRIFCNDRKTILNDLI